MSKQKVNHTNPGKKEAYNTQLGHSKSAGNPDVSHFQGTDSRTTPDTPTPFGATAHSQVVSGVGASPNRHRYSEAQKITEHGTTRYAHVTNQKKK
jgi:hypothetical protein